MHQRNLTTVETLGNSLKIEGFEVIIKSSKKNILFRMFDMLWHIFKYRKTVNFVLIDTYSTLSFWYAFFGSKLCQLLQLNYIPILHGGNLEYRLKQYPKLSNSLFNNAYTNIAPSNFMTTTFQKFGYKNLVVIPNSFELSNYNLYRRNSIQPHLLWVRSLAQIYNPKLALEVLKLVRVKYPSAHLTMVGPEKDVSKEQMQLWASELGVDVTLTGQLPKSEWIELSKDFDIFINTTNIDNTPVSVIEAMALGLPVVSTNVGGIPYLIEDKKEGLLVSPNNPQAMADVILHLLEQPELVQHVSQNARAKVETFDWNIVKNQWIELLK